VCSVYAVRSYPLKAPVAVFFFVLCIRGSKQADVNLRQTHPRPQPYLLA
jgi:hypothetical protein